MKALGLIAIVIGLGNIGQAVAGTNDCQDAFGSSSWNQVAVPKPTLMARFRLATGQESPVQQVVEADYRTVKDRDFENFDFVGIKLETWEIEKSDRPGYQPKTSNKLVPVHFIGWTDQVAPYAQQGENHLITWDYTSNGRFGQLFEGIIYDQHLFPMKPVLRIKERGILPFVPLEDRHSETLQLIRVLNPLRDRHESLKTPAIDVFSQLQLSLRYSLHLSRFAPRRYVQGQLVRHGSYGEGYFLTADRELIRIDPWQLVEAKEDNGIRPPALNDSTQLLAASLKRFREGFPHFKEIAAYPNWIVRKDGLKLKDVQHLKDHFAVLQTQENPVDAEEHFSGLLLVIRDGSAVGQNGAVTVTAYRHSHLKGFRWGSLGVLIPGFPNLIPYSDILAVNIGRTW